MSEIVADPPSAPCYHLFSELGIGSQRLDPDLVLPRAHAREGSRCRARTRARVRGKLAALIGF
jgi:hypothetical protein